ncbi:DsrE family protein [uncultured Lutibacter sp.]|uniref:DsrE family protein n=1 Tax=uncultured Lutibacter sp. TaxID=437739 RepID=UPI0026258E42|nr:DsrE family protein [uncultured Lutibacter sp.]
MKYFTILILLVNFSIISAQEIETKTGPIIEKYGKVYQVQNPDLELDKDTTYKVIFDIFTDKSQDDKVNPLLNAVARYLNMHAQQGISLDHMKTVVILHGAATKSTIDNVAYQNRYAIPNPNAEIITELKKANVEVYVCGQSYLASGFQLEEKSPNVKVALSALTALVEYQTKGYQIINFN